MCKGLACLSISIMTGPATFPCFAGNVRGGEDRRSISCLFAQESAHSDSQFHSLIPGESVSFVNGGMEG